MELSDAEVTQLHAAVNTILRILATADTRTQAQPVQTWLQAHLVHAPGHRAPVTQVRDTLNKALGTQLTSLQIGRHVAAPRQKSNGNVLYRDVLLIP